MINYQIIECFEAKGIILAGVAWISKEKQSLFIILLV